MNDMDQTLGARTRYNQDVTDTLTDVVDSVNFHCTQLILFTTILSCQSCLSCSFAYIIGYLIVTSHTPPSKNDRYLSKAK